MTTATAPAAPAPAAIDTGYALDDRYTRTTGRVFLSGSQALVRLPMMQRQRDLAAGLNTAGFISGYTGSPLGGYDIALKQAAPLLAEHHVHFQPGLNEDLGATAVWGSQQVGLVPGARYDGVFGIWYGKGPGVDRSGDALKHGSYAGTARHGGVLVLAGDDHGAKSSTTAHQSDHAFIHFGMPYLNPASVQDYLDFGLHGFAMSRLSGCWIGMKCVTDTIESSASVAVDPDRVRIVMPDGIADDGARATRWGVPALVAEKRQYQERLPAVLAYVRANGLNRAIIAPGDVRRLAIVTSGKATQDVMQALDALGLDAARCQALGLALYKVAMPWPLEPDGLLDVIDGFEAVLVIEEKRPVIEDQIARLLVNRATRPVLLGKHDENGAPLVPAEGELAAQPLALIIGDQLQRLSPDTALDARLRAWATPQNLPAAPGALTRLPSFCAGCPHNSSTRVPDGSMAFGGIGCHGMATFLPERNTPTLFQMGGEGAPWIGMAPFTDTPHIFQNLGDGTYYHSGLLAIRAAVAARVNITYKILANDAIAMTGGQVIEGKMRVDDLTRQLDAEGVGPIVVVTDNPDQYDASARFAPGVTVHHRRDLDAVQKRLRILPGVTAIVYDQTCATELRRRRKRGKAVEPDIRVVINPRVCEGCGDCSVQSNCIAIEPIETEFGRKRRINQSACNKDTACLEGYCPSFVTLRGATPRRRGGIPGQDRGGDLDIHALAAALPQPAMPALDVPYNILITGIGGAGVVTLGAMLGMAAHLEGRGCSVLDVTGLAQRNGAVASHVRLAAHPDALHATRIAAADLVIGSDIVVTASPDMLSRTRPDRTRAIVNRHVAPTADFARNPNLDLSAEAMAEAISRRVDTVEFTAATEIAYALMGNEVATNLLLVGYAWQRGWLPLSLAAIERAIALNGVAVAMNRAGLAWGRLLAHDPDRVHALLAPAAASADSAAADTPSLAARIALRVRELTAYQDAAYAARYQALVAQVQAVEARVAPGESHLAEAVARYYYKLLTYKDEYEVARLHSDPAFLAALREEFEGDFTVEFHMAPPVLQGRDPATGRYRKRRFGPWMMTALKGLARLRWLRGSWADPFGHATHRRLERALIRDYEADVGRLLAQLTPANHATAARIAAWPEMVRGYDTVKDSHIADMRRARAALFAQFDAATTGAAIAAPQAASAQQGEPA
ncbi:indolepyruvate ferredoxin oxidoreductase family protein [Parapedomonas caeni]